MTDAEVKRVMVGQSKGTVTDIAKDGQSNGEMVNVGMNSSDKDSDEAAITITNVKSLPEVKVEQHSNGSIAPQMASSKKSNFQKNAQYCGTGRLPCPDLGGNWTFEQIVRQQGRSAGRYDTYYFSPTGVKFRSKLKLQQYVGKDKDLSDFDYNSGKFPEKGGSGEAVPNATKDGKMSLLRTNELKTINRETKTILNDLKLPAQLLAKKLVMRLPNRHKQVKGPYTALLQTIEKRKQRKRGRRKKTRKVPVKVIPIQEVLWRTIDDTDPNPFHAFKQEALSLKDCFPERTDDFEELIQFAWNFLSIESKTQFNDENGNKASSPTFNLDAPSTSKVLEPKHAKDCLCAFCMEKLVTKGRRQLASSGLEISRRKRCGMCKGCLSKNCGRCVACKNMKKFGGTGSKKQSCMLRRCEALHSPTGPVSVVSQQSFFSPYSFPQPFSTSQPVTTGQHFPPFVQSPIDSSPLWPSPFEGDPPWKETARNSIFSKNDSSVEMAMPAFHRLQTFRPGVYPNFSELASNTVPMSFPANGLFQDVLSFSDSNPQSLELKISRKRPVTFDYKQQPHNKRSPFINGTAAGLPNMKDSTVGLPSVFRKIDLPLKSAVGDNGTMNTSSCSSNSVDSSLSLERNSVQKLHKRKSRVPVYIKQAPDEDSDIS